MLDLRFMSDIATRQMFLATSVAGKSLLTIPQLNKGTAFSMQERLDFGLLGKLPQAIETLEQQVKRAYKQFLTYDTNLRRNIFLHALLEKNQTLFYKLVSEHLEEMLPMIYTPIVGHAVKQYSVEFRQPRGLYIAYPDSRYISEILDNRSHPDIDLIVVTDGEGVLGIGDQGVGGMDIPIAKLMVYTLCGGINPLRTLPILLDVGTNNKALLDDPMYLGWHHERLKGQQYDEFVDHVIDAIEQKFPQVFLHWEDFGRANASRYLERYQNRVCTFNDDIQGTGAVALAGILASLQATDRKLSEQRIVIYGAGTAGCGIASEIYQAMVTHQDIDKDAARDCFYLLDRDGLILDNMSELTTGQEFFARKTQDFTLWQRDANGIRLATVVSEIKPTILIGCSAQTGAFTQDIITTMAKHTERPIILSLSNPTECAEATPQQISDWTNGKAILATGSPFDPITVGQESIVVAQCNNALAFPGIGLGIIAVKAKRLTPNMLWAAISTLSACSPLLEGKPQMLPRLGDVKDVARAIAVSVAKAAIADGVARVHQDDNIEHVVAGLAWEPNYIPYVHVGLDL